MWLIKSEEETSEAYGKRPEQRSIEEAIKNSLVIIDKHNGPTSHQIAAWLKEMLHAKNSGVAGILDPFATGVLPVALDNATKAMPLLVGLDKEYVGVMHLHKPVDENTLRDTVKNFFVGTIRQLPPVKSAVARKWRERKIYFFDILEIQDRDVLFKVGCEAGTYIRKIAHDVGQRLGVGAHLTELRRTKFGPFDEQQSCSLLAVNDAYEFWRENGDERQLRKILLQIEHAVLHVKHVFVKDSTIDAITNGSPVYVAGITRIQKGIEPGELVAVSSQKEELVALGIAKMGSEEMFKRKKGSAVRTDRVFMQKGVYPKISAEK